MKLAFSYSRLLIVVVAFFLLQPSLATHAQTTYFVDASAPLAGADGLQWSTAFPALEMALAQATNQDSVWVATGTYTPRTQTIQGDVRSVSFVVPAGVNVYGGFDGTEVTFDQRAGLFSQTVLNGEIGSPLPADNAYHVVTYENNFFGCVLDGFVIQDGNAIGAPAPNGGAVRTFNAWAVEFRNVFFEGNMAERGGALYSNLTALDAVSCTFRNNTATNDGGAVAVQAQRLRASHCFFLNNASRRRGGAVAMRNQGNTSELLNCVLAGNASLLNGGAVFVARGSVLSGGGILPGGNCRVTNCTVYGNTSVFGAGGGLWANESANIAPEIEVNNSIFWANSDSMSAGSDQIGGVFGTSFCNVQGGYAGVANINADPQLVNPAAENFRIRPTSPCRDAGSTALLLNDLLDVNQNGNYAQLVPIDIYGGQRVVVTIVDIGADETFPGNAGGGPAGQ